MHPKRQENGQGGDRGTQYRTGVYTHSEEQLAAALASVEKVRPSRRQGDDDKGGRERFSFRASTLENASSLRSPYDRSRPSTASPS